MVKQRIVIQVSMRCDKCGTIALKVVARADGVISMMITGVCKDLLEIVGEDVNIACLVKSLEKERLLCPVQILLVEEVKEKKEEKKKEEKKEEKKPPSCPCCSGCPCCPCHLPPTVVCQSYCRPICPPTMMLACEESPSPCSIM